MHTSYEGRFMLMNYSTYSTFWKVNADTDLGYLWFSEVMRRGWGKYQKWDHYDEAMLLTKGLSFMLCILLGPFYSASYDKYYLRI